MQRLIIANWKMNLNLSDATMLAQDCVKLSEAHPHIHVVVAPSLPWLVPIRESVRFMPPNFALASQVVSANAIGAYTGDVAAEQLKGLVTYCLVGHSERRRFHYENGSIISDQVKQLLAQNITPVVCFGEMTQSQSKLLSAQVTLDLGNDLAGLETQEIQECLFAYEPLWAIGTGNPATPEYVKHVIDQVKSWAKDKWQFAIPILYGGSVNEDNAAELGKITTLDGLLVGGASLHAKSFKKVCSLYDTSV